MELEQIKGLLDQIKGCTFASLDAETQPIPGVRRVVTGETVILFTNKTGSGYENMVRRRMEQAGLDPSLFNVGPLPWGERVPETPIIIHSHRPYLQAIPLILGVSEDYVGNVRLTVPVPSVKPHGEDVLGLGVVCRCYALKSITTIRLMGETIHDDTIHSPQVRS